MQHKNSIVKKEEGVYQFMKQRFEYSKIGLGRPLAAQVPETENKMLFQNLQRPAGIPLVLAKISAKNLVAGFLLLTGLSCMHQAAGVKYQRLYSLAERHATNTLQTAAAQGNMQAAKRAIQSGALINGFKKLPSKNPLFNACVEGHQEMALCLIYNGANPNLTGFGKNTPLHAVAATGQQVLAQVLIEHGAPLEAYNCDGESPLALAIREGQYDLASYLLSKGASIYARYPNKETILHRACRIGDTDAVQFLIAKGFDIQVLDEQGRSPLHIACKYGNETAVKVLIDNHARLDALDKNLQTPMHLACRYGHIAVAMSLVKAGVPLKEPDKRGWAPYQWAHYSGYQSLALLLLANLPGSGKEKLQTINTELVTQIARQYKQYSEQEIAEWLRFYIACRSGRMESVELLLEQNKLNHGLNHGIEITTRITPCGTAAHAACKGGRVDILRLLLSQKIPITQSFIEWAQRLPYTTPHLREIVHLLKEKRALLIKNATERPLKSALHDPTQTKTKQKKTVRFNLLNY